MASAKTTKLKQKLLAHARAESKALVPYVKRALARHAKSGKQVYIVDSSGKHAWVAVTYRGNVKEPAPPGYVATRAPAKKK